VPHLDPKYGGLSAAVPQLASAVAGYSGQGVSLAGFCSSEESHVDFHPGIALSRWPMSRMAWLRNSSWQERFRDQVRQADGVHVHGLWEQSTFVAVRTARSLRKPYVLSAHGMLDRWALNNKRLKKSIYAALIELRNVQAAACLHALTHMEAEDYRRFGAKQPIAVIPNGISVPEAIESRLFFERFPGLRGKRIILFLSRIHYKKGLDILIKAWAEVAKNFPEAHLVLAGPDFEGTRAGLERSVQEHGLGGTVLFAGMLDQQLKWSAFRAAECFILPSYSEGLSVAILEAMGCGVPVIVTEQCNLPEIAESGAGWTIQPTAEQVKCALVEMLSHSEAMNRRIGENGRRLVEKMYDWPLIGQKMSEVYAWVEGGAVPTSVELIRT
jgi:glycosyltransferase involved in cell wall biosynthesis